MVDEIDRDQEFNEQQLEVMITRARSTPVHAAASSFCHGCGEAIPENRRRLLPGTSLCIECQTESERQHRT